MKITRSAVQPEGVLAFENELESIGHGIKFGPVQVGSFRYSTQLAITVSKPANCKMSEGQIQEFVRQTYEKYRGQEDFIRCDSTETVYDGRDWHRIEKQNIPVKADTYSPILYWRNLQGSVKVTGENLHDVLEKYSDPSEGRFVFGKPNSPHSWVLPVTGTFAILKDGILETFYSDNSGRGLFLHLSKRISAGESSQRALRSFFGKNFYSFDMGGEL